MGLRGKKSASDTIKQQTQKENIEEMLTRRQVMKQQYKLFFRHPE